MSPQSVYSDLICSKDSGNLITLYILPSTSLRRGLEYCTEKTTPTTMCIVDKITFSGCAHISYFALFPCKSGFSTSQSSCNASAHIVRKYLSSTDSNDCRQCYQETLLSIRTDHASKYLDLDREARSLGWSSTDIQGSLMEMQAEMDAAVAEWKATCGRESDNDESKLGAFAESIHFQFGPEPAASGSGKPYLFHAGGGIVFMDPFAAKKGGRAKKITRVKALRAERGDLCNIAAPWYEPCLQRGS